MRPLLLIIAALTAMLIPIPAQAATTSITVMTENVAGATINRGEVKHRAATIKARMKQYNPTTFTAQEICYSQYRAVRAQIKNRYATAFATVTGHHCRGKYGDRWGIMVAVKGTILRKHVVKLPTPTPGEPRSLLCVDARIKARAVKVCTSHFSPYDPDRAIQAAYVRGLMAGYVKAGPVIFSGDLNLYTARAPLQAFRAVFPDPHMYTGGPTAISAAGLPHKIDHTFWTGTLTDRTTYADPLSDHRGVVAYGTLR